MEKINATISDVGSKWNPWAQKLSRGFSQVKQYAQEKMGNIEDITKLPQEYLDLEEVCIIKNFIMFTFINININITLILILK